MLKVQRPWSSSILRAKDKWAQHMHYVTPSLQLVPTFFRLYNVTIFLVWFPRGTINNIILFLGNLLADIQKYHLSNFHFPQFYGTLLWNTDLGQIWWRATEMESVWNFTQTGFFLKPKSARGEGKVGGWVKSFGNYVPIILQRCLLIIHDPTLLPYVGQADGWITFLWLHY